MDDIDVCSECRFMYNTADPNGVALHKKRHSEFINGVRANKFKSDITLGEIGDLQVILVKPTSPSIQRKRAEKIALNVRREMSFDHSSYYADDTKHEDTPLAFICVRKSHAVGLLVLRMTNKTAKINWSDYGPNKQVSLVNDK